MAGFSAELPDDEPLPVSESSFSRGLRSGATAAEAQLRAGAGRIAETVGAGEVAVDQYAQAKELGLRAQAEAPSINRFGDIAPLQGLRDAPRYLSDVGSYAAGQVGAAAPVLGVGLGAGLLAKSPAGKLAAGTASALPFTVGGQVQAQQEDAVQAARSLGDRNTAALGVGGGQAVLQSVLPAVVGSKLTGAMAGGASKLTLKEIIAKNATEAIGANAAAGAGSEVLAQKGAGFLDPNRDTSHDADAVKEAAIAGGLVGAPFGALGAAGEAAHSRAAGGKAAVGDALTRVRDQLGTTSDDAVTRAKGLFAKKEPADTSAERLSQGIPLVDDAAFANASPADAARMEQAGEQNAFQKAAEWAKELASDRLNPEQQEKLAAASENLADKGNQAYVASLKVARDLRGKATEAADNLLTALAGKGKPEDGPARSEGDDGPRRAVASALADVLAGARPEVTDNPQVAAKYVSAVRGIIDQAQTTGRIADVVEARLHAALGDDALSILTAVHDQVAGGDPARTENFYKAVADLQSREQLGGSLRDAVRQALPKERQGTVTRGELDEVVKYMKDHTEGRGLEKLGPAEATFKRGQVEQALEAHFPGKSKALLERFAKEAKGREKEEVTLAPDEVRGSEKTDPSQREVERAAENDADATKLTKGEDLESTFEKPTYYGGGKDPAKPQYVDHPDEHFKKYGNSDSPAKRLLAKAEAENPDRAVRFVSALDHARENGLPTEGIKPGTGLVEARGQRVDSRLTRDELDRMKHNTRDFGASKSRIPHEGGSLDATRVTAAMQKKLSTITGETSMQRKVRAFFEGIAAASDALGKKVELNDDSLVIDRSGTTLREIKQVKFSKDDPAWMKGKSDEEINTELRKRDTLAEMSDSEVRRLSDDFTTRAETEVQRRIDELKGNRERVTKERVAEIRAEVDKTPVGDAAKTLSKEQFKREQATKKADQELQDGKTDRTRADNVHEEEAGGEPAVRTKDLDDNPRRVLSDNKRLSLEEKLQSRVDVLSKGTALQRVLGSKLKGLLDKAGDMGELDRLRLERLVREPDAAKRAQLINDLAKAQGVEAKVEPIKGASKESTPADRFAEQVILGKPEDLKAIVDRVNASTDVKALQAGLEALPGHKNSAKVYEAINERISQLIEKDPTVSYSMQLAHDLSSVDPKNLSDAARRADTEAYIAKVLKDTVDVGWKKILHAGEFEPGKNGAKDVIRLSVHAFDPMSVAYHESLHAFMQQLRGSGDHQANKVLFQAADTHVVRAQLEKLLANEPEALKQIRTSSEERAAYMYQFWAEGKLTVGDKSNTVLGRIAAFIRHVTGTWSNDQRAQHIMEYFNSGEYGKNIADRSAVSRVLMEGTNPSIEKFKGMVQPFKQLAQSIATAGDARLRDTDNPALIKIADLVLRQGHGSGVNADAGYIPASREKRSQVMNGLADQLRGVSEAHLSEALEQLQSGVKAPSPEAQRAAATVRKTLDKMFDYLGAKGVAINDLGYGKDYFPRVWDVDYLTAHQDEFRTMMQKYVDNGTFKGSADAVIQKILRGNGSEITVETPGMQSSKERVLSFIEGPDFAPFGEKNLWRTMDAYVTQAARRGEWAERFGDRSEKLGDLLDEAKTKHGATAEEIAVAQKYMTGINGTLGDNINPKLRRAMGNMMVYQNIRLLPLAIFSSIIDPVGIVVRGGSIGDALTTMKRGMAEIPRNFQKAENRGRDEAYKLAEDLGTIDNAMLMHTLGSAYSQGMVGNVGRKINDTFFRFNLMEQFNTSMRVGATEAAVKFMGKHADGSFSKHSERWLGELGFKPGEMKLDAEGRPLVRFDDFKAAGMSDAAAQAASLKMAGAVNAWVDGAILRPNAAHKPIWANDPHFALMAHLKQFVYSFQHTIIDRVVNELEHGNFTPGVALASYVPIMIAADLAKGMIQGGGQQPDWKEGWTAGDYVWSGVQRAGLLGTGQFMSDAVSHKGGLGSLLGPTVEQLSEATQVVGGRSQFAPFAYKALPANALYASVAGGQATDPTFAD